MLENPYLYEHSCLVKLFHNEELRKTYLNDLLPGIFQDKKLRLIIFIIQQIYDKGVKLNVENIVLIQNAPLINVFRNKQKVFDKLIVDEVYNILFDVNIDSSVSYFKETYRTLHDLAFFYAVERVMESYKYDMDYKNKLGIVNTSKSLIKLYEILTRSKLKNRKDGIADTAKSINRRVPYLRVFSTKLTSLTGGWSRGSAGTIIGKPSHTKSTFTTFDSTFQIKTGILDRIDIISSEENEEMFWRRVFASELKMSMTKLMNGTINITDNDINKIKSIYEGKIIFHEINNDQDIFDLILSLKTQKIIVDHVNAIDYKNNDQLGGIQKLLKIEKQYLFVNKDAVVINLTQANTKEMLRKGRLIPAIEDAYCSSALEHASREFYAIYYPYKDAVAPETRSKFFGKETPKKDLVQVYALKNSFGDVGSVDFDYLYDYGIFKDSADKKVNITSPDIDLFKEIS